ncbi:hypothetical protein [Robiginitomaculum antarcticum]|uniref:hypothetical protein n=1 Tax=Robiginitomaculum antarcticum TaxID=437507 RepID=UPI00036D35A1|nr:hypothetical protein [Robiginitomaculum antarcticum]
MDSALAFDPLLAPWVIAVLVALGLVAAALTGTAKLRSFIPRALAVLIIGAALMNPQSVTEEREALPDVALIIVDKTESANIGQRAEAITEAANQLSTNLAARDGMEIVTVSIDPSDQGTQIVPPLLEGLANLPRDRIAGVFVISDGQVHDLPDNSQKLMTDGVPFHALIAGDASARDRRMSAINAPRFGLVDETVDFEIRVDDPGFDGEQALIQVRLNGREQATFNVTIGEKVTIPVTVERRGSNTVELIAQGVEGELTYVNNIFVQDMSGIRDRLRVLLITGEPHSGGRAWRNLLKSDPSVDLIQFSILRPPGKPFGANQDELSLIQFPVRQLFEDNVEEFDLIILDQYRRRQILSPYYFQNIARYVAGGGALLVAAGPPFAEPSSVYRSPLAAVLPVQPKGTISEGAFRPELTDKGERHPITSGFAGREAENWGQWYRAIDADVLSGDVLMRTQTDAPLLVLDEIGKGRAAMLLSDQAWLWARGVDGGGPYNEMFRRLAHWLMGEPDLEAERLSATITNGRMDIIRNTLSDEPQNARIIGPDGTAQMTELTRTSPGVYVGDIAAPEDGTYRVQSGTIQAIAAAGALNPTEFSDLIPTQEKLAPLVTATGGHSRLIGEGDIALPELRDVKPGAKLSGDGWAGLVRHARYDVTASTRKPFAPVLFFFALAALMMAWAWRAEGR